MVAKSMIIPPFPVSLKTTSRSVTRYGNPIVWRPKFTLWVVPSCPSFSVKFGRQSIGVIHTFLGSANVIGNCCILAFCGSEVCRPVQDSDDPWVGRSLRRRPSGNFHFVSIHWLCPHSRAANLYILCPQIVGSLYNFTPFYLHAFLFTKRQLPRGNFWD